MPYLYVLPGESENVPERVPQRGVNCLHEFVFVLQLIYTVISDCWPSLSAVHCAVWRSCLSLSHSLQRVKNLVSRLHFMQLSLKLAATAWGIFCIT